VVVDARSRSEESQVQKCAEMHAAHVGSIPGADTLDSGFHPSGTAKGKMRSNFIMYLVR